MKPRRRALALLALLAVNACTACAPSAETDPRCQPGSNYLLSREDLSLCSHVPTHDGITDPEVGSPGILSALANCPVVYRSLDTGDPTPPVLVAPGGSSVQSDGTRLGLAGIGTFEAYARLPRVRYVRRTIPLQEQPKSWRVCNSIYFVFVAPA